LKEMNVEVGLKSVHYRRTRLETGACRHSPLKHAHDVESEEKKVVTENHKAELNPSAVKEGRVSEEKGVRSQSVRAGFLTKLINSLRRHGSNERDGKKRKKKGQLSSTSFSERSAKKKFRRGGKMVGLR